MRKASSTCLHTICGLSLLWSSQLAAWKILKRKREKKEEENFSIYIFFDPTRMQDVSSYNLYFIARHTTV
jgi:hypothetical protein